MTLIAIDSVNNTSQLSALIIDVILNCEGLFYLPTYTYIQAYIPKGVDIGILYD